MVVVLSLWDWSVSYRGARIVRGPLRKPLSRKDAGVATHEFEQTNGLAKGELNNAMDFRVFFCRGFGARPES